MATLAGQRTQFTWALNQYNITDDPDEKEKFVRRMAKYIANAPVNGFSTEQVTQGQSYPASEVEKFLKGAGSRTSPTFQNKLRRIRWRRR